MTDENDKRRVLHLYHVEMLYAAVVEAFIEWQTAIVEAVIRASLSDATPPCLRAHERSTSAAPPRWRTSCSSRPPIGKAGSGAASATTATSCAAFGTI